MSRTRLTWQNKKASPPPQIPAVDRTEKGDHPAYYPDPEYGDFAKGDPDAWAETPTPPPYLETAPPAMPGNLTTEEPDHPAYPDLEVMPPSTPVTAKQARLYRQAALCQYIATKLQEQSGRRVPMEQFRSIERKASKRQALTSEENSTFALIKAIERQAAELMDLPHADLLKTAKILGRSIPKDSALAVSARRDWSLFSKMAAEMDEKEKAEDEDKDDEEGKQAFFDEIMAEDEKDEDEKKDKLPDFLKKDKEAKLRSAQKRRAAEDEDKDKDEKKEDKFPFNLEKKKEAARLKKLQAALDLFAEDDDEEPEDEKDAGKKAEEEEKEKDEDDETKQARQLLAKYLKLSKKAEDDDEDEDEEPEDEDDEDDENPFASKKKASNKIAALAYLMKVAEEEEDDEKEDKPSKEAKSKSAKAKATKQAKILDFVEREISKMERSVGRGKRADASEVAPEGPFAGLVDDVIAEDQDGDGIDQNSPTYGYSSKKATQMLLAAVEKLEKKAQKRKKAQHSRSAEEIELQALLTELDRLAEDSDEKDEEKKDEEPGKTATPEAQISVAPRNPNADSGAGGNIDPEKAPVTPEVEGPMTGGTAVTAEEQVACPEDMMDMGLDDPMGIMDLGIEEGNALDSAMMSDDVDPADLVDFELMAEVQPQPAQTLPKQASQTKPVLRPQPKKASAGAQKLGQVAAPQQASEVDDLSQLWGSVPDVRSVFGMPKTY